MLNMTADGNYSQMVENHPKTIRTDTLKIKHTTQIITQNVLDNLFFVQLDF